jgi:heptosyltransferase-2
LETSFTEPSTWPGITVDFDPQYQGAIVICPGATETSHRWTGYEDLVKLWVDQHFVILGEKEELKERSSIGRRLPHRVKNFTGKTTLEEAAAIMAGASVVIANDTGLLQLAGYLGVPTVGIYGGSSPKWKRPLGEAIRVVSSPDTSCQFCFKKDCSKKNYRCMTTIRSDYVISAAMEIMKQ